MKMPVLLQGRTMTEAERLYPLSMSQNWKENGESTASMTMRKEDTDIPIGGWVRVFSPNGMDAVMYVKTKRTDYVTGITTYSLAHCWQMLDEMVLFGEITPDMMGGSETEVGPADAIRYLLGRQTTELFQLGTCCSDTAQGWKFQNSDIRSDLQGIADTVLDCCWTFSMDTLPWTLNLANWETQAAAEMRMNRNLSTLTVSLDRSNMYTRVYPVGNKDLHIDGDYIDRHTATWGVISKVITDSSIDNKQQLRAWALKMLKRNADPVVNVSISGMELSQATGESLDALTIGRVCRIPLPEYGTTVTDRITDISWKDVTQDEVACTVTLANERKTVQGVLNEIANGGGAGGKKGFTKGGCDLHDHEGQLKDHWTYIRRNDYYIRLEAYERLNGDQYNYSYIEQTASYIRSEVGETANGLYSRIIQTASSWEARVEGVVDEYGRVTAASIATSINTQTGLSMVKLSADIIDIDGIVDELTSYDVSVGTLDVERQAQFNEAVYVTGDDAFLEADTIHVNDGIDVDGNTLNVADVQISGNTLTVYYVDGTHQDFSKAITLSAAVGSGKVTVNANSNQASWDVAFGGSYASTRTNLEIVLDGTVTAGTIPNTIDIPIKVQRLTGSQSQPADIGYSKTITAYYAGGGGSAPVVTFDTFSTATKETVTGTAVSGSYSTPIELSLVKESYSSGSSSLIGVTVKNGSTAVGRINVNPAAVWVTGSSTSSSRDVELRAGGTVGNTITAKLTQDDTYAYLDWNGNKLRLTKKTWSINIPSAQIYTTAGSPPSGSTKLTTMKTRIQEAIADSETLVFRVDYGTVHEYYHIEF